MQIYSFHLRKTLNGNCYHLSFLFVCNLQFASFTMQLYNFAAFYDLNNQASVDVACIQWHLLGLSDWLLSISM